MIIGTSVLFVQRGARKIREAVFSYEAGRFVGANITIYARHITRTGVRWLAWQQEPEEALGRPQRRDAARSPAQSRASGQGLLEGRARRRLGDRRRLDRERRRQAAMIFGSSPSSTAPRRF
jgi:hypothetical protein